MCGFSFLLMRINRLRESGLVIWRARYGAKHVQEDVTEIVRLHIKKNESLSLLVDYEHLGIDPCKQIEKDLTVDYSIDGKKMRRVAHEKSVLILP